MRNLNVKDLNDNKQFWKKIKPFFLDKDLASSNIVLKEMGNGFTDNQKLANLSNTYFIILLKKITLKILISLIIFLFYENHDSISKIQ